MSTEQSEAFQAIANSQGETPQVDIKQQATTPTPAARMKNPKRVAAGKAVAERTRLAREQQKKAAAEAAIIIANNKAKAAATPEPTPLSTKLIADESPKSNKVDNSSLSTTQWIGVAGIVVSLIGIYYKREELKAAFSKKNTPEPARDEPQPARPTQTRVLRHMD